MPGYYKKRRVNSGPTKNEEKAARTIEQKRQERSGDTLAHLYPNVQRIAIELEILSPQKLQLSKETRIFNPGDRYKFSVPCPGRCGQGSFDLAGKIEQVVTNRERTSTSHGQCKEPLYAGAAETCACELNCKIEITFLPEPEPEAPQPAA
ncbi:MAG: hypothetical protein HY078_17355 [Elusimicrobia bacterium]|nr:hypothetical protein [Elusimicrobiota bacterium]